LHKDIWESMWMNHTVSLTHHPHTMLRFDDKTIADMYC
jgi:hypothetical protein